MSELGVPEAFLLILKALAGRNWWPVSELPPELTPNVARALDALGWLEANQNPRSPLPPKWYSPLARGGDDLFGSWGAILNHGDTRTEQIGVRVSPQGHVAIVTSGQARPPERRGATEGELSPEAKALAVLAQHPDWTNTQIADAVGCSRPSLYRWPRFRKARAVIKPGRESTPRGTKDAETGRIEAWDKDDE